MLKIKNIVKRDSHLTRLLEKYDSSVTFPFGNAANVREYLIACTWLIRFRQTLPRFAKMDFKKNRTTHEMKNPSIFSSTN